MTKRSAISNNGTETPPSKEEEQSAPLSRPVEPLPDGGAVAWLQCAGAFCLLFNSWGLVNTFGVYQTYYKSYFPSSVSSSSISWIGSIQAFLFVFGGIVSGPLYDRGHLQALVRGGSFCVVFGMMMTSLASQYWQIVLAQGLVVGMGCGMFFVPSMALLPTYFDKKRALSAGLAISGASLGGVVYTIVFHRLQPSIGFRWATRVIAFISMGMLIVPMTFLRMRIKPETARPLFDLQPWKEKPFYNMAASCFIGLVGLYIPYFYINNFALEKGIIRSDLAFYLLPIMNAGACIGRIILSYIADKVGYINMLLVGALFSSILGFAWAGVSSLNGLIAWGVFYGCFSGTYLSLIMTTVASRLCPDLTSIGLRIGMMCFPIAIGLLIGSPLGGAASQNGWIGLQILTGVTLALAVVGIITLRIQKVGWRLHARI